jgi:hypothetical protein
VRVRRDASDRQRGPTSGGTTLRLLKAIRVKLLSPETVRYLITVVNRHLDTFRVAESEAFRRLEQELGQIEEELRNVERAILAGVVSETTAACSRLEPRRHKQRPVN